MSKLTPTAATPDIATLLPHPISAEYPMAGTADSEALKASIRERGFLPNEPITLYNGMILDGRNRFKAGKAVAHKWTKENFVLFTGTHDEAVEYSNAKNGARRHLTNEEKAERVRNAIADDPLASSRDLARKLGVSPSTIEKYRNEKTAEEKDYNKARSAMLALSDLAQRKLIDEVLSNLDT
jgi:ParB-like chromosome segregation protein Spo0J